MQVPDELAKLDLLAGSKGAASAVAPEVVPGEPEVAAASAKVQLDCDNSLCSHMLQIASCHPR